VCVFVELNGDQISSERELHSLTIAEVFKEDAGNYVVKASNSAGSARCFASLTVKTGAEKHMVKTRLVESSHSTIKTAAVGHTPPEFTRLFRDTRVRPGEPCTLEVGIAANPPPTVSQFLYVCMSIVLEQSHESETWITFYVF